MQFFYRVNTMCFSLPKFLFSTIKAFKKLITGNERRVCLLLCYKLAQVFSCSLQQILVFGNDAHVAEYLSIHLYCGHNYNLIVGCKVKQIL